MDADGWCLLQKTRNVHGDIMGSVNIEDMPMSKIPHHSEDDDHPGHKVLYTPEGERLQKQKNTDMFAGSSSERMPPSAQAMTPEQWDVLAPWNGLLQPEFPTSEVALQRSWKVARPQRMMDLTQRVG